MIADQHDDDIDADDTYDNYGAGHADSDSVMDDPDGTAVRVVSPKATQGSWESRKAADRRTSRGDAYANDATEVGDIYKKPLMGSVRTSSLTTDTRRYKPKGAIKAKDGNVDVISDGRVTRYEGSDVETFGTGYAEEDEYEEEDGDGDDEDDDYFDYDDREMLPVKGRVMRGDADKGRRGGGAGRTSEAMATPANPKPYSVRAAPAAAENKGGRQKGRLAGVLQTAKKRRDN
jgi:hypothetical protein